MEKKFKRGLVLGKFMPPHNGHLHLINTAATDCEKLFVIVGTLKSQPINGILRYNWLKMIYADNKNIEIIHCADDNPQKPEECESVDSFYNDFWVPSVYNRVVKLNVVFTSEKYGEEFSKYLGIEHVLVDLGRETCPVSGTKVRNNPFLYWDYIPDVVKPYFAKRIVAMGPESTGKSTIIQRLAEYYGGEYLEEYGRTYTRLWIKGKHLKKEDFYKIAKEHDEQLLIKYTSTVDKYLFIDTEAITTKLFGQLYLENYEDERVDEIIKHQWFDLILLMDVDVPWVDDGTRDFPNARQRHFDMIKAELDSLGRKYVVIKGNYDERLALAKKEVEKLGYL